jgi:hypothetical protein
LKKLLTLMLGTLMVIGLTGCSYPDGVDGEFYNSANEMFDEIDEDTMEMEISDTDDLRNLKLLTRQATTDKENAIAEAVIAMAGAQQGALKDTEADFDKYMDAREDFSELMEQPVTEFQFTEED